MKERYERHGLSNAELKNRLTRVREVLEYGTGRAHAAAREIVEKIYDALDLDYLQKYR